MMTDAANSLPASIETDHLSPTTVSKDQTDDVKVQTPTRFAGDSIRNVTLDIPSSPQRQKESKEGLDIPHDDPINIQEEQDATASSTSPQSSPSEEEDLQNNSSQLHKEHSQVLSSLFPLPLSLNQSSSNGHEGSTSNIQPSLLHEELKVLSEDTLAESVPSEIPESAAATTTMPISPTVHKTSRTSTLSSPPIVIMLAPLLRTGTTSPPPSTETLVPSDENDSVDGSSCLRDMGDGIVRTMEYHDIRAKSAIGPNDFNSSWNVPKVDSFHYRQCPRIRCRRTMRIRQRHTIPTLVTIKRRR